MLKQRTHSEQITMLELVQDLLISKMKNVTLQDTLTFETLSPDEVLRALKYEQSKHTTHVFQKTNANTPGASQSNGTQIRMKQEPIRTIGTNVRVESSIKENRKKLELTQDLPLNNDHVTNAVEQPLRNI